jgi:hypothetical protein
MVINSTSASLRRALVPTMTPPRMKMIVSATKTKTFQNSWVFYLAYAENFVFPNAAMYNPIDTRAIIPLILIPKSTNYETKYNM